MIEMLTPRRGRLLKHVIEEYVVSAQPVSSEVLVRKYVPMISSATVRNELAALEGYGYVYQPHTSSGRVPSDLGYRYYVESLMGGARLSEAEERMISHQFHQVEDDVGEWIRLAASVLSSSVQSPVMVAPPRARVSRLRRIDLLRIGHAAVLAVVMLRSGDVRQQVVRTHEDVTPDALTALANEWNTTLVGRSAAEIRRLAAASVDQPLLEAIVHLVGSADGRELDNVLVDGLSYIAAQPEFGTRERFLPVVEALERHGVLSSLMEPLLRSGGVYVAIGREQPLERLRECSVVVATYGRKDEMLGVVGVIGPTRFAYWRAVPMVIYVAGMLDRLLEETFLT